MNSQVSVTIDGGVISIQLPDGRSTELKACDWPRLKDASDQQLADFYISDCGIHWPELDEDLSFDGLFDNTGCPSKLYAMFMQLPEINVSAFARTLGISQSLMAQYISGTKKPSAEREAQIIDSLHSLGKRLAAI